MKTVVSRQSEENIDALKQKRQRIKLNRNSGREYINRLGKVVQARKVGKPCNCPMKCWERMGSKVVVIFNNFWDLCDFNLQNSYLFTCLKLCDVKRRYTKKPAEESRRQNTFEYFVRISGKHVRVCKRAFMSAHGLTSDKRLRTLLAQMKDGALLPVYDRRGKHLRPLKPAGHMESNSHHSSSQLGLSSSTAMTSSNSSNRNNKKSRVSSNTNSSTKRRTNATAGPSNSSSNHSSRDNLNHHLSGLGAGAMYGSGGAHSTASGALLSSGPPGTLVQTAGPGTLVQIHGVVPHCGSVVGSPSSGAHGPGGGVLTSVVTSSGGGPVHPPSVSGMQEPPHAYIPNGELYFPGHYLEPGQGMSHINQIPPQCQKMLDGPAYFMAGMKENTFHQ